jgi:hypothetical protein
MTRWLKPASMLAFVGSTALMILGWVANPEQGASSYLIAYSYVFTTVLGMLLMITIGHLSYSQWFVLVRRLAEAIVGTLPLLCVLFVPVLLSLGHLYGWMHPETLEREARHAVEARGAFQTAPMFTIRSIIYLGVATACGELLYFYSRRQDRRDPALATRTMRILSGMILPIASVVLTFAGFDWIMSIEPGWYSDMFGVYVFAGGFLSALCWLLLGTAWARRQDKIPQDFGMPHLHALGTLIFAFVIFWTYIAFCQYMLIWIGNIPAEIRFYLLRTTGAYEAFAIGLVLIHFAIPFAVLLFRVVKRHAASLGAVCVLLVVAHYVDLHWVIAPVIHPAGPKLHWLDVVCLVSVMSATTLAATIRFEHSASVPRNDPLFEKGLSYGGVP